MRAGLVASLNATMFGAVRLSSLLLSPLHVLALMTAVAMFTVLPNARVSEGVHVLTMRINSYTQ